MFPYERATSALMEWKRDMHFKGLPQKEFNAVVDPAGPGCRSTEVLWETGRIGPTTHYYAAECEEHEYGDMCWKLKDFKFETPPTTARRLESLSLKHDIDYAFLDTGRALRKALCRWIRDDLQPRLPVGAYVGLTALRNDRQDDLMSIVRRLLSRYGCPSHLEQMLRSEHHQTSLLALAALQLSLSRCRLERWMAEEFSIFDKGSKMRGGGHMFIAGFRIVNADAAPIEPRLVAAFNEEIDGVSFEAGIR